LCYFINDPRRKVPKKLDVHSVNEKEDSLFTAMQKTDIKKRGDLNLNISSLL